tara:strand:- start:9451 stop:9585 length:135 start_codon:yes stop_codon:yes gene_type:complete
MYFAPYYLKTLNEDEKRASKILRMEGYKEEKGLLYNPFIISKTD